jgi:hypothetical protein
MLVGHGKGDNRYFYPGRRKNVSARPNFCNSTKIGNSLNFWSAVYACKSTCMSWGWTILNFIRQNPTNTFARSAKTFHFY